MDVALSWGVLRSSNLVMSLKFTSDRPTVAMIKPSGCFEQKIGCSSAMEKHDPESYTKRYFRVTIFGTIDISCHG